MSVDGTTVSGRVCGRDVVAVSDVGLLSSDGGLLLLKEARREVGFLSRRARAIRDGRQSGKVRQGVLAMLTHRVFGIACGYNLASQQTLCRLENTVTKKDLYRLPGSLLSVFVERHRERPPKRFVLDADATDDPAYGRQGFEFDHGYYQTHGFRPLWVHATADDGEQDLIA